MTTLSNIRFIAERQVKATLEDEDIINWCNDAQSDFMVKIDIPASTTIAITTTNLDYALPTDFKKIGRMVLQSDLERNVDVPMYAQYRVYNGRIYFQTNFSQVDTINLDYYKHMKYFTDTTDALDLPDRYSPLYTSYCQAQYYCTPAAQDKGEQHARREYDKHYTRYMNMKEQIAAYYTSQLQQAQIQGVW